MYVHTVVDASKTEQFIKEYITKKAYPSQCAEPHRCQLYQRRSHTTDDTTIYAQW